FVFVVQAGGDSNDLPGAFFVMAAIALALRARRVGSAGDLLWSAVAIALASGNKASNSALALPWLAVALPSWRLAWSRPLASLGAMLLAAVCSFLPNAILNVRHAGEWSGATLEFGAKVTHAP